jgi:tetratricopeptide (TPR) repeat protein
VSAASSDAAKIPITTTSDEARKEFLQGVDLSDRLLGQESLQHFDKAIALDPTFASAELARANNSVTAKDFFDHQKKAMALADKVSEGEKLLILANEAGTNGDVAKQKEYLEKVVAAYPNDERAQFALANYYFGQQDVDQAINHYKKTTELAPNYSGTYNSLGYAYRQQGDYAAAEQAFKKYIELIPNDPNPYDSYAELLLKMGRFDDSIAQYRKALSVDPHFPSSHFGICADEMYLGKPDEATAELQKIADNARNDGELRTAFFGMAVVATDSGKLDKALQAMDKEYAVAEKKNDAAAMAADRQAKANILAEIPNYDEAKRQFDPFFSDDSGVVLVTGHQGQRETPARIQPGWDCHCEERLCDGKSACRGGQQGRGSHQELAASAAGPRTGGQDCAGREGQRPSYCRTATSQPARPSQPVSLEPGL